MSRNAQRAGPSRSGDKRVQPRRFSNAQDRRWLKRIAVRVPFEPWLWFFYHYLFKLAILEGRPGLIACQIRRQCIANVRAKGFELKRRGAEAVGD